nr:Fic family protein [Bryobacter sp.]
QELWLKQKPEVLAALRQQAMIQSVESSNRIEGVTVERERLRPLLIGRARPRDRSEEELAGYRRALDWIFRLRQPAEMTPEVIRKLHALAQGGHSSDAGEWKKRDNEIIEILADGRRRVRFVPTTAKDTPRRMAELCRNYEGLTGENRVPPLLLTATFVFDLLSIHPFRDGNGRVSRLATTLLLESRGFLVGRYVSLERLVEERKEEYYSVLHASSEGWHEGKNDIVPWWNFILSVVRGAYREWERMVEDSHARPAKGELVRATILEQTGPFTLADLCAQFPAASPQLVKKILGGMKAQGLLRLTGRGRGAQWRQVRRD